MRINTSRSGKDMPVVASNPSRLQVVHVATSAGSGGSVAPGQFQNDARTGKHCCVHKNWYENMPALDISTQRRGDARKFRVTRGRYFQHSGLPRLSWRGQRCLMPGAHLRRTWSGSDCENDRCGRSSGVYLWHRAQTPFSKKRGLVFLRFLKWRIWIGQTKKSDGPRGTKESPTRRPNLQEIKRFKRHCCTATFVAAHSYREANIVTP